MSVLQFCVSLYRANPGLYRVLSFPGTFTFGELTELLAISAGLGPMTGEVRLEDGTCVSDGDPVADRLRPGASVKILLREDESFPEPLIFYADFVKEEPELSVSVPCVAEAFGSQLPPGVPDISVINRIRQNTEPVIQYRSKIWSEGMLKYSQKKTENEIRRRFAPGTAVKLVNTELGLPISIYAESLRNQDIKEILDRLGGYYDSQSRKAELVYAFSSYWMDLTHYEKIFDRLPLSEMLIFSEMATGESLSGDAPERVPFLAERGLIAETKKGIFFSRHFLEYYAAQLEKKGDDYYVRRIYLRTAAQLCLSLYGIFSAQMFYELLKVLAGELVSEEEARKYLESAARFVVSQSTGTAVFYNDEEFKDNEVLPFWNRVLHTPGSFRIPDRQELLKRSEVLYLISDKNADEMRELTAFIERRYLYWGGGADRLDLLYYFWHRGGKAGDMVSYMNQKILGRWDQWTAPVGKSEERFVLLWAEEAKDFPKVLLGGYSENNCPPEVRAHYEELLREQKKKEAEAAAAKVKPAAKGRRKK